jgi:hypothetical protein
MNGYQEIKINQLDVLVVKRRIGISLKGVKKYE